MTDHRGSPPNADTPFTPAARSASSRVRQKERFWPTPPHCGLPLSMTFDLARLGWKFLMVVALRAAKLAAGGPAAILEMQRMTAEKTAAMLEAQTAAAMALATGSSPRAATRKAVAPYRRRVKANRRRLVRKK